MGFLSNLFSTPKINCPRCLGKGHVDNDDIKRLKRDLHWIPGDCAYCDGMGKVSSKMAAKVKTDSSYLNTGIPLEERKRFVAGDEGALNRAKQYEQNYNHFFKQVRFLHFVGNLDPLKITDFFLLTPDEEAITTAEKEEIKTHIEKIIAFTKKG
jgi:hypothetical protein